MKKIFITAFIVVMLLQVFAIGEDATEPSFVFALPQKLLNAENAGSKLSEDKDGVTVLYVPAEEEDLEYYINLSNLCGTYCYLRNDTYFLMRAEKTDPIGALLYDAENKVIALQLIFDEEGHLYIRGEEDLEPILELFDRDLILPEGSGKNTFPQFYACVATLPYLNETKPSGFFDGMDAWTEHYDGITADNLRNYTLYMMLFGFDLTIEGVEKMDDGNTVHVFHYSNGDAEVYVLYKTETQDTVVTYKPGVSYYLLSASELNTALGGN